MSVFRINDSTLHLILAVSFAFNSVSPVVGWFDDFNDGSVLDNSPKSWSQQDIGTGAILPGTYDATSGDYRLWTPGDPRTNTLISWVDTDSFEDSYIRAQALVVPTELDGNLLLLGRIETTQKNAYILSLDSSGELQIQVTLFGGFSILTLETVHLGDLNSKSDIIFELDVITDSSLGGNRLYGYVWRPGNRKPAAPQISAADTTYVEYVPQGPAGIGFNEVNEHIDDNAAGLFRVVAAQNVPFIEGDYNFNNKIDAADYVLWRKNSGAAADYNTWRSNFGLSSVAGSFVSNTNAKYASVPEPINALHLALAFILVSRRYRRQSVVP